MHVRVGLWGKLSAKELMLLNCGVGRLLRVPWTARRSKQSILKEMSPGCSLEGMMLKLKPVLCPPHAKSWLIGKDSDAGRDWGQEETGTTEDEVAGWHHWLDGHESEWTPGVGDGQGGLACYDSWGCKESDTTEWLNWPELNWQALTSSQGMCYCWSMGRTWYHSYLVTFRGGRAFSHLLLSRIRSLLYIICENICYSHEFSEWV